MKYLIIAGLALSLPIAASAADKPSKPVSPDKLTCIYNNIVYTVGFAKRRAAALEARYKAWNQRCTKPEPNQ